VLPVALAAGHGRDGPIGGLASSTAVTFGLSHRAREAAEGLAKCFALGIVIASTIMFLRQLLLTFVIEPRLAYGLILPMVLPVAVGAGAGIFLWQQKGAEQEAALVKGGIAAFLGGREFCRIILPILGVVTLATVVASIAMARS